MWPCCGRLVLRGSLASSQDINRAAIEGILGLRSVPAQRVFFDEQKTDLRPTLRHFRRTDGLVSLLRRGTYILIQGSSGAADDLQKVRNLAHAMIVKYGMSDIFPNYAPVETQG